MRKFLQLILLILLVLQTFVLGIIAIQRSDSVTFRLTVGFIGLGLVITPFVLRTTISLAEDKGNALTRFLDLVMLAFMLVSPWIPILVEGSHIGSAMHNDLIISSSALKLTSAALGFFAVGILSAASRRSGDDAGPVLRGVRILASLLLLWFAAYSLLPVLTRIAPLFRELTPFAMHPNSWGGSLAANCGDPWLWLLDCLLAGWMYQRFYAEWILGDGL